MKTFRFWCQKVLPLVYDDSLSYYELLCKVVDYINKLIEQDKVFSGDIAVLKQEIKEIQDQLDNLNTDFFAELVTHWLATMVFFGLSESGYFVAFIPDSWKTVSFNTTGYDINVPIMPEYGHLVLSY